MFESDTIKCMESKLSIKGDPSLKNRLEILRKQKGIKQEELAEALEVSRQTIGSLENGRYNPSIILAFKLARYFNTTIEEIFIYEEEKNDEN
ncbi:helix-turn-helix transcriptional regulator [Methanosarcina spelaei]|nr:helix-turn-helix transcriptional regulator [Methanosarcina spelaei]